MSLAEIQFTSLLHLSLEICLFAGLILLLFRIRNRFGFGPLYVFIGANQYLQAVLSGAVRLDLGGGISVSVGSVVVFSSTLFAILLTYLQEDIPRTRSLIYGIIFANCSLTGLSWLTNYQINTLAESRLLSLPQELFTINPRSFLIGTGTLIVDAFLIVILYEFLLSKARGLPMGLRLVATLLFVLYFDALIFSTGAFLGTARFERILLNQLVGKTIAGVLYGLILYLYIQLTTRPQQPATEMVPPETGIFSIVTFREKYQQVKQQLATAEAANLAKNRFLAHMSHELRTPLNAVIGFTNVLLKNKAGNLHPKELLYLERILGNGKHLLALINGILDLSKVESGRFEIQVENFSLNDLVTQTAGELRGQALEKQLAIMTDLPKFEVICTSDRSVLKQVLINLLGNALKFTEKGRVTIRMNADPAGRSALSLEVIDTGIGIPPEDLDRIFEAFRQAQLENRGHYGGTGLGLAISRALCEQLGFRLEVESEPGRGSTFRIAMA